MAKTKDSPLKKLGPLVGLPAFRVSSDRDRVRIVTIVGGKDAAGVDLNGEELDEFMRVLGEHRAKLK